MLLNPSLDISITPYTFPNLLWEQLRNIPFFRDRDISFVNSRPKDQVSNPVVAYRIHRRWPGLDGKEQYTPRLRGKFNKDGDLWELWGQWWSIIYQFECFAKTNDEADELAWALEQAIYAVIPALKSEITVEKVLFDEQLDSSVLSDNDNLNVRVLRYLVVINLVTAHPVNTIKSIDIINQHDRRCSALKMTRGSTDSDILNIDRLIKVNAVFKVLSPNKDDYLYYVEDVDYSIITNGQSQTISWLTKGVHPSVNNIYYIIYSSYVAQETTEIFD